LHISPGKKLEVNCGHYPLYFHRLEVILLDTLFLTIAIFGVDFVMLNPLVLDYCLLNKSLEELKDGNVWLYVLENIIRQKKT